MGGGPSAPAAYNINTSNRYIYILHCSVCCMHVLTLTSTEPSSTTVVPFVTTPARATPAEASRSPAANRRRRDMLLLGTLWW